MSRADRQFLILEVYRATELRPELLYIEDTEQAVRCVKISGHKSIIYGKTAKIKI